MSITAKRWSAVAAVVVISLVVSVVYASSLTTGFFADDYNFLEPVARLGLSDYLVHYFDPRVQVLWYRPLQGVQILIEWILFGANATGYHAVNILLHAINCSLLFAIVWRISKKWHLAFAAAVLYATFPVYALAVNWINITDPLATIFYLLGIWFWRNYLERGRRRDFFFTLSAYVLGILCKQMAITLPVVLFLMERLLMDARVPLETKSLWTVLDSLRLPQAIRRYWAFIAVLFAFAAIQYGARSTHTFAGVFGYSPGLQMLSILIQYASLSVFPWGYFIPNDTQITEGMPFSDERNLIWLGVAVLLYLFIVWRSRSRPLIFLGLAWLVTISPVLPFPFIELRYLYLPIMTSGIVLGMLFDHALNVLRRPRWVVAIACIAAVFIVIGSRASIANANAGIFEIARQRRVPFRDIVQMHPTFPEDTRLYFIDSISPISEMIGMFTLRYGPGVTASGNDAPDPRPQLRAHRQAYVYYFDETGKPRELAVESLISVQPSLHFPLEYKVPIRLEDVELSRATLKRGDLLAVFLYWRATGKIENDYTVFVHLVDKDGKVIAGHDSPPRSAKSQTSTWQPYVLMVDPVLLPIPADAPLGRDDYLEIGLYEFPSLQRLAVMNAPAGVNADTLVIAPLNVVPNGD